MQRKYVAVATFIVSAMLCGSAHAATTSVEMTWMSIANWYFKIGEKRILLYRVDFSNVAGAAISSNTAAGLFGELNNYYRDMSYGKMSFALAEAGSVVTDTLRLPEPSSAYDNNFEKLISDARQVATTSM